MLFTRATRCPRFGLSPSGGIGDDGEGEVDGEDGGGGGSEIFSPSLSPEAPDVFEAADTADSVMLLPKSEELRSHSKSMSLVLWGKKYAKNLTQCDMGVGRG